MNSEIISISLEIVNRGPSFESISSYISHEAGVPISDASLIFGVNAISDYDKFYYYHNRPDISYSGTNFDISFEPSFNQEKPTTGTYIIKYIATDQNSVEKTLERILDISDTTGPNIILEGLSYEEIGLFQEYVDSGVIFEDMGSDLSHITIDLCYNSNIIRDISNVSNINNSIFTLFLIL